MFRVDFLLKRMSVIPVRRMASLGFEQVSIALENLGPYDINHMIFMFSSRLSSV